MTIKATMNKPKMTILDIMNQINNPNNILNQLGKPLQIGKSIITPNNILNQLGAPLKISPRPLFASKPKSSIEYYANDLWTISENINEATPTSVEDINELAEAVARDKEKAENNYFKRLAAERSTVNNSSCKVENEQLREENAELRQQVKEYEKCINNISNILPKLQKQSNIKPITLTLKAGLTPSQIVELQKGLQSVFDGTIEQWRALFFDSSIQLSTPIRILQHKSDLAVLFYYLRENKFIERKNYASILEKSKAFYFEGEIMTAKKIGVAPQCDNFPYMGNFEVIELVVTALM